MLPRCSVYSKLKRVIIAYKMLDLLLILSFSSRDSANSLQACFYNNWDDGAKPLHCSNFMHMLIDVFIKFI